VRAEREGAGAAGHGIVEQVTVATCAKVIGGSEEELIGGGEVIDTRSPAVRQAKGIMRLGHHRIATPPSSGTIAPVINFAAGETGYPTAAATSSTVARSKRNPFGPGGSDGRIGEGLSAKVSFQ